MRRIVIIAGAVLVILLALMFADCTLHTTCMADLCVRQWLHCAATVLSPNVLAALVTVGLGGLIAWWYQRANKIMEFRFNTFERAMRAYSDLSAAAWARLTTFARWEILRQQGTPLAEPAISRVKNLRQELDATDQALHEAIMAGHTIIAVQSVLFPREITDHWGRMMTCFQAATEDDVWIAEEAIYNAPEHRLAYLRGVAQAIRLPFPEPHEWTQAAVERHRAQIRELFQQAQPRPNPRDGGQR